MRHPMESLRRLRRPRILVSAARFGLDDYRRDTALRLALRGHHDGPPPPPLAALTLLLAVEARLEEMRQQRDAVWRPARHIAVLTAIMAEALAASAPAVISDAPARPDAGALF